MGIWAGNGVNYSHPLPVTATRRMGNGSSKGGGCGKYAAQSVRALPIRIVTVGKKRWSQGVELLVDEYVSKLKHYTHVILFPLRSNPRNSSDARVQVDDEDMSMISLMTSDDWVVLLDERGDDISSEQMADLIADAGSMGTSRLSFCIGGPYGHGPLMRKRANVSIRLSSMVLNHQIALVVLVEQLYRFLNDWLSEYGSRDYSFLHCCDTYLLCVVELNAAWFDVGHLAMFDLQLLSFHVLINNMAIYLTWQNGKLVHAVVCDGSRDYRSLLELSRSHIVNRIHNTQQLIEPFAHNHVSAMWISSWISRGIVQLLMLFCFIVLVLGALDECAHLTL